MRPSDLKPALSHLVDTQSPAMIWSAPGLGKSDIVASIAEERKMGLIDFRLAMRDPTDIKGFPMPDAKSNTMKFMRDGELPTKGKGILFLDEINSAAPATMAAAMQLTLTRKIGDYTLPPGWAIIAAGNRESDRSVVNRMPSALSLRLRHLDLEVSLDDWCDWAMNNAMRTELIAFLRFRPELLHKFDPSARSSPNPRSWAFVNKDLDANLSNSVLQNILNGTVGEGAGTEFMAFLGVFRDLPSIDTILLNPDSTPVPTKPAVQYALSGALGLRLTDATFDRAMQFINRMPKEFQVLTIRDAARKTPTIASTKAFTKWAIDNQAVLM
jgi:hypothetical protein